MERRNPGRPTWRGEIKEALPSANVYMRLHWRKRAELAKKWYILVYTALFYESVTKATARRRVRITIRSSRERDWSNQVLCADKLCADQLVKLGYLVDDSPTWLKLQVEGEVGEPRTLIEIWEGA